MLFYHAIPHEVRVLLHQLSPLEALHSFALGGGTSLALRFAHRWSVDLDFFTRDEFEPDVIFDKMGLTKATILFQARNSLTFEVSGVKVDLLRHHYPLLCPSEMVEGVRLLSPSDLTAMKINAIVNRGSKKDFFDLAFLLDHIPLREMLGHYRDKYAQCDPFVAIRSLAWFEDAEVEPDPISLMGATWLSVKSKISRAIHHL